jgi:endonuclease/exonuclease/phosphatase family metal-dependent hydrolase
VGGYNPVMTTVLLTLFALLVPTALPAAQAPNPAPQAPAAAAAAVQPREPLTVMTFNIRYGTAKDGENEWSARRDMLFEVIRDTKPDLLGLQEALDFQIDEILAAVGGYAVVGVGRDDGAEKGEYSAILFRSDRFHVAEAGTFWFSDTPSVPGSKSWGNQITRISSWARFIDRDGRGFYHFNLHLDHQSQPSRERSTVLLRGRIDTRAVPDPVIVTGDFNVGENNPALATLTAGSPAPFVDTFRVLHPDVKDVGTFSGFKVGSIGTEKIDYVLVRPGTEVLSAEINRVSRNGRYPSDHFPVTARIRLVDR